MKTVRETGFGGLPGFTDDGDGDGNSRLLMVARVVVLFLSPCCRDPLSLSPLLPLSLPLLFSLFFSFLPWFSLGFPFSLFFLLSFSL